MAAIRSTDTKPELVLRKGLHAQGFRFRLHDKRLPGKPDIVFPRYRAVIFVNGCFWHGHDCSLFRWPATREEFWRKKIGENSRRDQENVRNLLDLDWRIATVWECALKGRGKLRPEAAIDELASWLRSGDVRLILRGATSPLGASNPSG